ncbi:hypothetical protein HanIR_Chr11g0547011 [Helianthus annuus]|nr:hypothetical protein HanIR_Chr11g0547011 [Helianthus annuus]
MGYFFEDLTSSFLCTIGNHITILLYIRVSVFLSNPTHARWCGGGKGGVEASTTPAHRLVARHGCGVERGGRNVHRHGGKYGGCCGGGSLVR